MANHQSAAKRARQSLKKKLENRYYARTTRNAVRKLRGLKDKDKAAELFPGVAAMLDKLAKRSIIHKNKASNLKSGLQNHVNSL
ncbi:MAG: 30S ribosomal protein S20 [Marinilabiliales bacterium]|nr:MAG: 30S ribosomal protein S20 [Marinilabiliales bacterium]